MKYTANPDGSRGRTMVYFRYKKAKGRGMNDKWAEYYVVDQFFVSMCLWYYKITYPKYHGKGPLFRQWRNGQSHNQVYGKKYWYSKHYRLVAKLLKLPNWEDFVGHSMCRTAASIMCANGM